MTKSATEGELALLHSKVAQVMNRQLTQCDLAQRLLVEHTGELPEDVQDFLENVSDVSPALLGAVIKFLKDNEISALKEDSKDLTELERTLAKKKERKIVGNVIPMIDDD